MSDLTDTTVSGTGAQPAPSGTTEAHGVADIQRHISAAFAEFDKVDAARKLAKSDADLATDAAIGEREKKLRSLAAIAHKAAWSEDDTTEAVKKAIELHAGNDKSKKSSLSTFASEIKLACGKRVRGHVADMFDLARTAWDDERAAAATDSDAPQPLKKAYSRLYHVVVQGMMRAAKDGWLVPTNAEELNEFALRAIEARRVDYKRVKARLDNIKKELQGFHDDFPVEGIAACIEFLGEVDTDDLKACRDRADAADAAKADEPEHVEPEQEDEAEPQTAGDMLEDALRDQLACAA